MCGLTGFVGDGGREVLNAMTAALSHRGPDGDGIYIDPETAVHLGHRRLAILDAPGGHQPMWNEDQTIGIVFNGEIYNYAELRAELVACGHVFASDHSDTETLVHGYEEWGIDMLPRLNGMFAFAIYDQPRRRILLAVDRFSEKPLYYTIGQKPFAFASEIGSLLRHPAIGRRLSGSGVQKYFAYGYFPGRATLYDGIARLEPGHFLIHDLAGGTGEPQPYWQFRLTPDDALTDRQEPRLVEELRHLLTQAVTRRLISDVPLGVFLSGGIDSSAIVMAAAKAGGTTKTFTIGFDEASFDESPYARQVADYFGTEHHERILDKSAGFALIPQVLSRLSEPLGDASIIPTYMVSAFARETVTVALSGDGGDELFGGYDPFKALGPAALYKRVVPAPLHSAIQGLAARMPVSTRNMALDFKVKRTLRGLSHHAALWNPVWMSPLSPEEIASVFEQPLSAEELYEDAIALWNRPGAGSTIDRTLEFYTNFYLPGDILTKSDRAAMMVSLEGRAIFLDNDLVEFCRRLPSRFKFRDGNGKYLLKKALEGHLPPEILARRKKGFGVPLTKWLRDLPETRFPAIDGMRQAQIDRLWAEHRGGRNDHRLALWSWLSLQYAMRANAT